MLPVRSVLFVMTRGMSEPYKVRVAGFNSCCQLAVVHKDVVCDDKRNERAIFVGWQKTHILRFDDFGDASRRLYEDMYILRTPHR
jgi:hypothetical protein